MSRSLCDEVAKQAGVTSEPEIYHEHLGKDVVYLCMATDGSVFDSSFVSVEWSVVSVERYRVFMDVKVRQRKCVEEVDVERCCLVI